MLVKIVAYTMSLSGCNK